MKRIFVTIILFILLLTGCASQPTAAPTEMVTPQPNITPLPPTETHTPIPSPTACLESELPYEQQKTMIENRFEQGSQAFEALIKEDGNLEYYDGSWHTLEAMCNINGEIIPWGESYDMVSEEGRNGILTNIMAGNEALMEEHVYYYDNSKKNAEKAGFDTTNFNVLYVQFFPNIESLAGQHISETIGYYEMQGQIVVKNTNSKILVINLITYFNNTILHTYVKSESVLSRSSSDLYREEAFDNGFLGINSVEMLDYYLRNQISQIPSRNDPAEKDWLKKVLNANIKNFIKEVTSNPDLISGDLYNIRFIIYHNH